MFPLLKSRTSEQRVSLLSKQETWMTGQEGNPRGRDPKLTGDRWWWQRNYSKNFLHPHGFLNGRTSTTQCPPISPVYASVTVKSEMRSMQIPIQLIVSSHSMKVIDTQALVDSGADISCIDQHFIRKHNLSTMKLSISIQARNADHSHNKNEDIWYTCDLFVNIQGLIQKVTLHVMTCGKENIILGLPWLKKANPTINWTMQTLILDKSIDKSWDLYQHHTMDMTRHQSHYQPTPQLPKHINMDMIKEDHLSPYLNQETKFQYIRWALDNCAIHWIIRCGSCFLPSNSPVIACLTTTTELAITTKKAKPKPLLPPEYTPYALVFLKEATDHVPPFRPYNHEIKLVDETFKPKISKVNSLSPEEWKATEDFLDENLWTGKIYYNFPSSSTYSPTVFLLYSPYLAHYLSRRHSPLPYC